MKISLFIFRGGRSIHDDHEILHLVKIYGYMVLFKGGFVSCSTSKRISVSNSKVERNIMGYVHARETRLPTPSLP